MHTTGKDLRDERTLAGLSVQAMAEAMSVSRTTFWTIEKSGFVKPQTAQAYRDAIARLTKAAA